MRVSLAWLVLIAPLATLSAACSGAGTTGSNGSLYQDVAGDYRGAFSGDDEGVALDADMIISLDQHQATLDGWFHWQGALTDGDIYLEVFLGGQLAGSITPGNEPSISLVATTPTCPGYSAEYSGSYEPVSRTLTIEGTIEVLSLVCTVARSYDATIAMEWQNPVAQNTRRPNGRSELDGRGGPNR